MAVSRTLKLCNVYLKAGIVVATGNAEQILVVVTTQAAACSYQAQLGLKDIILLIA